MKNTTIKSSQENIRISDNEYFKLKEDYDLFKKLATIINRNMTNREVSILSHEINLLNESKVSLKAYINIKEKLQNCIIFSSKELLNIFDEELHKQVKNVKRVYDIKELLSGYNKLKKIYKRVDAKVNKARTVCNEFNSNMQTPESREKARVISDAGILSNKCCINRMEKLLQSTNLLGGLYDPALSPNSRLSELYSIITSQELNDTVSSFSEAWRWDKAEIDYKIKELTNNVYIKGLKGPTESEQTMLYYKKIALLKDIEKRRSVQQELIALAKPFRSKSRIAKEEALALAEQEFHTKL